MNILNNPFFSDGVNAEVK